jgi:hypothetical protein
MTCGCARAGAGSDSTRRYSESPSRHRRGSLARRTTRIQTQEMKRDRSRITARVVPLRSDEAGDGRVGGTAAERLALVGELSRRAWALTKQPLPCYTRQTMPVRLTTLAEQ